MYPKYPLTTSPYDDLRQRVRSILSDEDAEEFVTQFLWLILDNSFSMEKQSDVVHEESLGILSGLAEANKASTDTRILVKLALFNSDIQSFNDVHLAPEQLADTFTREEYRCCGSTSASAVYKYIDSELSRSKPAVKQLKKNSPGFLFVMVTDAEVNDSQALREQARKLLESNRFFRDYGKLLVIFLGDEKHKPSAVALANGKEDCVITLDDSMTALLSPIIVNSTVTFTDGTHVNSTGKHSLTDMAEDARKRSAEGTSSAEELADDELIKLFSDLMGKS